MLAKIAETTSGVNRILEEKKTVVKATLMKNLFISKMNPNQALLELLGDPRYN